MIKATKLNNITIDVTGIATLHPEFEFIYYDTAIVRLVYLPETEDYMVSIYPEKYSASTVKKINEILQDVLNLKIVLKRAKGYYTAFVETDIDITPVVELSFEYRLNIKIRQDKVKVYQC